MTLRYHERHECHLVDVSSIVIGLELHRKRVLTNQRQHTIVGKKYRPVTPIAKYLDIFKYECKVLDVFPCVVETAREV